MKSRLIVPLAGSTLFVGIPVLVWGPGSPAAFLQHPARAAYLVLTLLAQILTIVFVPDAGLSQPAGPHAVARQRIVVFLLQGLTLAIVILAPVSDRRQWCVIPGDGVRYCGVLLYGIGVFLMNWAVVHLGRHFSVQVTIQPNHRLITSGPYRWVRHPRYLGIMLCFSGIALVFASIPAAVVAALLLPTILWRILDEEAVMAKAFVAEWPAYAQSTASLLGAFKDQLED